MIAFVSNGLIEGEIQANRRMCCYPFFTGQLISSNHVHPTRHIPSHPSMANLSLLLTCDKRDDNILPQGMLQEGLLFVGLGRRRRCLIPIIGRDVFHGAYANCRDGSCKCMLCPPQRLSTLCLDHSSSFLKTKNYSVLLFAELVRFKGQVY
jgi:hypothetical protein